MSEESHIATVHHISNEDQALIYKAKHNLENVGAIIRKLNQLGSTIETGFDKLSPEKRKKLDDIAHKTLVGMIRANLLTLERNTGKPSSDYVYKAAVTSSGFIGGFFGLAGFATDLLISTKLMMRTILDIARSEGEDITKIDTHLVCLEVFALGGPSTEDDAADTSYYATRFALSSALKGASAYVAKNGPIAIDQFLVLSGNPIMKFLGIIAARFGVQVTEKFMAQAVPVVGAIGGGSINFIFIDHFQKIARAHFTIRRLEREYGENAVRNLYNTAV